MRHLTDDFSSWGNSGGYSEVRCQRIRVVAVLSMTGQGTLVFGHSWLCVCGEEEPPLHLKRRGASRTDLGQVAIQCLLQT